MKKNRLIIKFLMIIYILFFCCVILLIATEKTVRKDKENMEESNKRFKITTDFINKNTEIELIYNNLVYDKNTKINIKIKNFEVKYADYKIVIDYNDNIEEKRMEEQIYCYELKGLKEGINKIHITVYNGKEVMKDETIKIYAIFPYEKQFIDELNRNGVNVHYRDSNPIYEDYDKSINPLSELGVNYIRTDFLQDSVKDRDTGMYDFTKYDKWINKINENKKALKIIAIVDGYYEHGGNKILDNDIEIEEYINYINILKNKYPQINYFQILNEPNSYADWKINYNNRNDIKWYSKIFKKLVKNKNNYNIISSGTETPDKEDEKKITSIDFYNEFANTEGIKYTNNISFHPYAFNDLYRLNKIVNEHREYSINNGGFNYLNITEYGTSLQYLNEEIQANDLVKQSIVLDNKNINFKILYNLWTTSKNEKSLEQFGLLTNDYLPRKSYYSMKNYYGNTNGAEYLGNIAILGELEIHVYDKDGKPVIIAWSNNNDKNIEIDYKNFTAKDIYGKEIKPNENGKLQITTSPVYIYNLDNKYYYKAISNTALQKYTEFEQKFQTEISNIPGLQQKIDSLKQYIKQIESKTTESENIAKQKMKEHFELGNTILSAYQKGELNIEYVKLSSMLDLLNDIGNSYEDLVTVSAKTRNPNLSETKTIINDAEKNINNNADLEIIYPQKILKFSKDLYEKAEYINSLEEENEIKTGLIVSNDLHAKYLAQWSKEFTDIYIEDYIKNNPITEKYSTKEITNQDVTVTLNILPDTKIKNNKNSNIYTFTQNGEFIFEYQRRGRNFTKTVKVENIDKIAPQIINIKNEAKYTESIIPKIEEENLEKVTLTKNEEEIEYILGKEIEEEGKYKLTVTDKAGNISEVNFEILKYQEDSYIIDKDKIRNIKNNTTKEYFTEKLNMPGKYKILHNKEELETEDIVSSGDILQLEDGKTYTLIVAGDINQDGKVTAYDLSMLRKTILNVKELNEVEKLAADVNCDNNKIGAKDYSSMKLIILGK